MIDNTWRKSSHSANGQCLEVRAALPNGTIEVRNSTDPHGPQLTFTPGSWRNFINDIKTNKIS